MEECPTPKKAKFGDEEAANSRVTSILKKEPRAARKVYKCRCGYWHLANLDGQRRRRAYERKRGRA